MANDLTETNFRFLDAIYDKDQIWFVDVKTKCLVNVCLKTGKTTIEKIPKEFIRVYRRVIKRDSNIYMISNNGCTLCCGEVNGKVTLNKIYDCPECNEVIVKDAFLIKNQIWCIPRLTSQPIIVFDLERNTFILKDSFLTKEATSSIVTPSESLMSVVCIDNTIYFTKESGNALYQYDCEQECIKEWKMPEGYIISGFDGDGDTFYIRSKLGFELYKWSKVEGILNTYKLRDANEKEIAECNAKVNILSEDRILLTPVFSDTIAYFDCKKECINRVKNIDNLKHDIGSENATYSIGNLLYNGRVVLFPWGQKNLIEINLGDMNAEILKIQLSEDDKCFLNWEKWKDGPMQYETEFNTLKDKLKLVAEFANNEFKGEMELKGCGKYIYTELNQLH